MRIFPANGVIDLTGSRASCSGYTLSNEDSRRFVYSRRNIGGTYLGIGSHQNFDHICRLKPNRAILIDISDQVSAHLSELRTGLTTAKGPENILGTLEKPGTDEIDPETGECENTWLRRLQDFTFIQGLARAGNLAIVRGNIIDKEFINIVMGIDGEITAAYFSNAETYIFEEGNYGDFIFGLKYLPWSNDPVILRTMGNSRTIIDSATGNQQPFHYQVLQGRERFLFDTWSIPFDRTEFRRFFLGFGSNS